MNLINTNNKFFWSRSFPWLAVLFAAVLPMSAATLVQTNDAPVQTNVVFVVKLSVFNMPASPKEGRDPFFPNSLRPYATTVVANAPTTDLSSLVMQSTLGTHDHPLVVINNVTFAVGDDAEVITPQGRIRIHCIAITDDAAVIEAVGQRLVLHFGVKP